MEDAIDGLAVATKADLDFHFEKIQQFLLQIKNELLTEQKRMSERMLHSLHSDGHVNHGLAQSPCIPEDRSLSMVTPVSSLKSSANSTKSARLLVSPYRQQLSAGLASIARAPDRSGSNVSTGGIKAVGSMKGLASRSGSGSRWSNQLGNKRFSKELVEKELDISSRAPRDFNAPGIRSLTQSLDSEFAWRFTEFILSPTFDVGCGAVICLNAISLGVETEYLAQEGEIPAEFAIFNLVFNGWYLMELGLRIFAERRSFLTGPNKYWNVLDAILTATAIVDILLSSVLNSANLKSARILRSVRLFRIVRTLRILRQFTYVREFRKMVCSMLASVQTLFWSLLLVLGVMYSFALWFTQTAAYYRKDNSNDAAHANILVDLGKHYAPFSRTVFSLFAAITGGYSWHVLIDPWIEGRFHVTVLLFLAYVSITIFGLMNIVTSIFVESAMHATKYFQDLLVDEKRKDLEMYTAHMEAIFHVIDQDGGGTISFEEMESFLDDETSELRAYLEAIGITSNDVWVLFRLLDEHVTGTINIESFCSGCMRLKGEARSFDINCMLFESRALAKRQADFMEFVEEQFQIILKQFPLLQTNIDNMFARRVALLIPKMVAQPNTPDEPHSFDIPTTPRDERASTPRKGASAFKKQAAPGRPLPQPTSFNQGLSLDLQGMSQDLPPC